MRRGSGILCCGWWGSLQLGQFFAALAIDAAQGKRSHPWDPISTLAWEVNSRMSVFHLLPLLKS